MTRGIDPTILGTPVGTMTEAREALALMAWVFVNTQGEAFCTAASHRLFTTTIPFFTEHVSGSAVQYDIE